MFTLEYTVFEILWTFSIFLEATTIVPQLLLLQKLKTVENMTSHYVFCLGAYRALYIVHWITRYMDVGYIPNVSLCAGVI
jgi:ER lumen protein retaining receptor